QRRLDRARGGGGGERCASRAIAAASFPAAVGTCGDADRRDSVPVPFVAKLATGRPLCPRGVTRRGVDRRPLVPGPARRLGAFQANRPTPAGLRRPTRPGGGSNRRGDRSRGRCVACRTSAQGLTRAMSPPSEEGSVAAFLSAPGCRSADPACFDRSGEI